MDIVPAGLFPEHLLVEIGALLSPDNPLNRDVRDLAGILDFGNEEIHYICTKDFPFKYMLDQWCKRVGDEATMENLKVALQELKRPDAVEVVEEAKKEVENKNFSQLHKLINEQNCRLDKDTGFVNLREEKQGNGTIINNGDILSSGDNNEINALQSENPPKVFIVYFPESVEHLDNVRELTAYLRSMAIDARADIFETLESHNKQLYILNSIQKSDFVLIMCSTTLKHSEKLINKKNTSKLSDKIKELLFVMNLVISDIYRKKSKNCKYIPVLLPNCKDSDVPRTLIAPKRYRIPNDYDSLVRRLFKIETYMLPQVTGKTKKTFLPRLFQH